MALVEVARFADLREARVAKSALEAVGFNPFLFDEFRASVIWTEQAAIGGLRMMAVEEEADDAKAFLDAPRRRVIPKSRIGTGYDSGGIAPTLGMLLAGSAFGWPLAGLKRPDFFHKATAIALIILTIPPIAAWIFWQIRR